MGIKQLYNDNLRKLPNEYGDVSVMRLCRGSSSEKSETNAKWHHRSKLCRAPNSEKVKITLSISDLSTFLLKKWILKGIPVEKLVMQNFIFTASIKYMVTYIKFLTAEDKQIWHKFINILLCSIIIIKQPFNWQSDLIDFLCLIYFLTFSSLQLIDQLCPPFFSSSWKQLRVKLTTSDPQLYNRKGVWGGKVKIINNVCNCGLQE